MKKLIALVIGLTLSVSAFAGYKDYAYNIDVVNQRAVGSLADSNAQIISGVLAFVYNAGTKTLATLYSDNKRTSLTNPISRSQFATDDAVKFWTAQSSVDIVLAHSDGSIAKYASVVPETHRLVLNQDGVEKCLILPYGASDNTETDTGIDLPVNVWVQDVAMEVVTSDPSETLSIGLLSSETNGDADGFIVTADASTAGFVKPLAHTAGSSEKYVSTFSYGALMGAGVVGTDSDGDFGLGAVPGHIVSGANAKSVTYTGSAGSDTAAGYIYVWFRHLR